MPWIVLVSHCPRKKDTNIVSVRWGCFGEAILGSRNVRTVFFHFVERQKNIWLCVCNFTWAWPELAMLQPAPNSACQEPWQSGGAQVTWTQSLVLPLQCWYWNSGQQFHLVTERIAQIESSAKLWDCCQNSWAATTADLHVYICPAIPGFLWVGQKGPKVWLQRQKDIRLPL